MSTGQKFITSTYTEPSESSTNLHSLLLQDPFNIILPSIPSPKQTLTLSISEQNSVHLSVLQVCTKLLDLII
jgi:hypothetical protein